MEQASGEALGSEGFTQVKSRRRSRGSSEQKQCMDEVGKLGGSSNPFQILGERAEVQPQEGEVVGRTLETEMMGMEDANKSEARPVSMEAKEAEDMDLGELDLDALEAKCRKDGSGYVPREQIELL